VGVNSGGPVPARLDRSRLDRLLGGPELGWLRDRVRRRLERAEPLTGPVSLAGPSPAQRAAVERLLGRAPGTGRTLTVRLDAVDAVLRRSGASPEGLAAAVAALTGPVARLSDVRDSEARAWEQSYAPLRMLAAQRPELADWCVKVRTDGLVRRLARTPDAARDLVADAVTALRALPADPAVSLPAFAVRILGSAHALDDGTPPATLVLSAVRALTGFPDGSGTEWRREAWASVGLLRDDLSSTVLTLGLRGTPALDWLAEAGEPVVLTLRQLSRHAPTEVPAAVRICENPAVLAAAADRYASACPPLVCLQGQPSAAAVTLLRHLHQHGATLHYHGDFDWGGLRIAASLLRRVPWRPWRYTAVDYRAAATGTVSSLSGTPTESPWDPELALSLAALGVRVEEEAVLDELISDVFRPCE
jgi:uncharacterized protein (TIGR02679 family)